MEGRGFEDVPVDRLEDGSNFAPNDLDVFVTITGTGFTAERSGLSCSWVAHQQNWPAHTKCLY